MPHDGPLNAPIFLRLAVLMKNIRYLYMGGSATNTDQANEVMTKMIVRILANNPPLETIYLTMSDHDPSRVLDALSNSNCTTLKKLEMAKNPSWFATEANREKLIAVIIRQ